MKTCSVYLRVFILAKTLAATIRLRSIRDRQSVNNPPATSRKGPNQRTYVVGFTGSFSGRVLRAFQSIFLSCSSAIPANGSQDLLVAGESSVSDSENVFKRRCLFRPMFLHTLTV